MDLVADYQSVQKQVGRFNRDLAADKKDATGRRLSERLKMNRAWYYIPELDAVGPSKFIGYEGMSAAKYRPDQLDGKDTEPVLRTWFRKLEASSPEEAVVRAKVEALLARFGKQPNKAVRYCAPIGWRAVKEPKPRPEGRSSGRHTIHATISRGESQFVAECEHLAVVTQGHSVDETLRNLKEAVELHLEGEDLEALGLVPEPIVVVTMEIAPWAA